MPTERVLTATEAAELLNVSPRALKGWAARQIVPGRKWGRAWRFSEAALLAELRRSGNEQGTPVEVR